MSADSLERDLFAFEFMKYTLTPGDSVTVAPSNRWRFTYDEHEFLYQYSVRLE